MTMSKDQNHVTNKQQTNKHIIQSHRIGSTNPSTINDPNHTWWSENHRPPSLYHRQNSKEDVTHM